MLLGVFVYESTESVASVELEKPVEVVAADGIDPALGERVRVRHPKWGADDLDTLTAEDIVEFAKS